MNCRVTSSMTRQTGLHYDTLDVHSFPTSWWCVRNFVSVCRKATYDTDSLFPISGSPRRSRSLSLFSGTESIASYRISRYTLRTSQRSFRGCVARDFRNYMHTRGLGVPRLVSGHPPIWKKK